MARPSHDGGQAAEAVRQTVEFLITLALSVLLFRTFVAEAYIVPTGSMAPTLLGIHRDLACPSCGFHFAVGMDEQGRSARPVCPNCGRADLEGAEALACNGDRLLVQKFLFDLRPPRRWEVAVFNSPSEPDQAYVKRVVGLPGESIRIAGGDIYIGGRIARKTLAEQRAMRVLVYDNDFAPGGVPRWSGGRRGRPGGWRVEGGRLLHAGDDAGTGGGVDWLRYRHWDPDGRRYGPMRDFCPYNGGDGQGGNPVPDLMIEAEVAVGADVEALLVRLGGGPEADRFVVAIPVGGRGPVSVRRRGRELPVEGAWGGLEPSEAGAPRFARLEASLMDRRLTVALDGRLLFDPIDFDDPAPDPNLREDAFAFGVRGGRAEICGVRLYRDVYYTSALAGAPRRPFAVDVPYQLGAGEFFVLGDNSPVSNDSRFWPLSPVVPADRFLGKPFLVHLPSQGVPVQVFGRELYRIPDPREIRYIR